jgi:hypothetical protein
MRLSLAWSAPGSSSFSPARSYITSHRFQQAACIPGQTDEIEKARQRGERPRYRVESRTSQQVRGEVHDPVIILLVIACANGCGSINLRQFRVSSHRGGGNKKPNLVCFRHPGRLIARVYVCSVTPVQITLRSLARCGWPSEAKSIARDARHGVVHVICPLKMLTSGGGLRSRGRIPPKMGANIDGLKNHLATHRTTPTSAKSIGE